MKVHREQGTADQKQLIAGVGTIAAQGSSGSGSGDHTAAPPTPPAAVPAPQETDEAVKDEIAALEVAPEQESCNERYNTLARRDRKAW
eukprot:6076006-Amphidinium_carterae.1